MFKKIINTYLMTIIFIITLLFISYINFIDSRDTMIELIQDESENTLNVITARLEDYFSASENNLYVILELVTKEIKSNNIDNVKNVLNAPFENTTYKNNYELALIDIKGNYIYTCPCDNNFKGKNIKELSTGGLQKYIETACKTKKLQVSDIFKLNNNEFAIATIAPVVIDDNVPLLLVQTCKTEVIGKKNIYGNFSNTKNMAFGIDKRGIKVFSFHKDLIGKDVYDNTAFNLTELTKENYMKMIDGVEFRGKHEGIDESKPKDKNSKYQVGPKYIVSKPVYINGDFKFSLAVTNADKSIKFLDKFVIKELGLFLIFTFLIVFLYYRIQKSHYEKKRLEKSLEESEASEKLKTEFFCNMSHELRTPLTVILNGLHFILRKHEEELEKDEDLRKMFLKIKQNALRLLKLVNNLLEISRIDAGMISREPENLDVVKIVEDISMSVVFFAQQKNIALIFDTEIEEKIIALDEDGIERIVTNLLSNAIKFTPAGGKVLVSIYEDKEYVNISVKDTGIGVPEDKLQFIFERFTQVNEKELIRTAEGTGVGLAIVKSMVEMHNGKIEVKSKKNKGTEFIVRIPNKIIEEKTVKTTKKLDQEILNNINIEFSDIQ